MKHKNTCELVFSDFEFVSDFMLQISDFCYPHLSTYISVTFGATCEDHDALLFENGNGTISDNFSLARRSRVENFFVFHGHCYDRALRFLLIHIFVMSFLLSGAAFLFLMTVLVLLHELGHFIAARRAGVIVEEFGFGLPPRVTTLFVRGGTRFSLNWIPFGGFVRLRGENALDEGERAAIGSFSSANIPARVMILTAGVFMNFVLAIVIFTGGFSFGHWVPTYLSFDEMRQAAERKEISMEPAVLIEEVTSGGTAAKVGVPKNALLLSVDGHVVTDPEEVSPLQQGKRSVTYVVELAPDYKTRKTFSVPLEDGKSGVALRTYLRHLTAPRRSVLQAIGLALREAKVMTVQTTVGLAKLFRSLASSGRIPEGITGIIGIAQMTHASVQEGLATYLRLVALLSLSLAILNILPLPALDGGRLLFVLIEAIGRRPVNRRFELTTNALGFAFLILLILLITYHDIIRLF